MCSRYTLICTEGFGERFGISDQPAGFRSTYNVAPGRSMPVIIRRDRTEAVMMRWGLIPRWAKDGKTARIAINARSDTLAERPTFRGLLKNYRCLIPASGFFEWKREGMRKVPYYIRLIGCEYIAFAGLYDIWRDAQGADHLTYTVITTGANELIESIHDRMPVILRRQEEGRWLSGDLLPAPDLHHILCPYPAGEMEAYPVAGKVNDPNIDEEALVRPLTHLT